MASEDVSGSHTRNTSAANASDAAPSWFVAAMEQLKRDLLTTMDDKLTTMDDKLTTMDDKLTTLVHTVRVVGSTVGIDVQEDGSIANAARHGRGGGVSMWAGLHTTPSGTKVEEGDGDGSGVGDGDIEDLVMVVKKAFRTFHHSVSSTSVYNATKQFQDVNHVQWWCRFFSDELLHCLCISPSQFSKTTPLSKPWLCARGLVVTKAEGWTSFSANWTFSDDGCTPCPEHIPDQKEEQFQARLRKWMITGKVPDESDEVHFDNEAEKTTLSWNAKAKSVVCDKTADNESKSSTPIKAPSLVSFAHLARGECDIFVHQRSTHNRVKMKNSTVLVVEVKTTKSIGDLEQLLMYLDASTLTETKFRDKAVGVLIYPDEWISVIIERQDNDLRPSYCSCVVPEERRTLETLHTFALWNAKQRQEDLAEHDLWSCVSDEAHFRELFKATWATVSMNKGVSMENMLPCSLECDMLGNHTDDFTEENKNTIYQLFLQRRNKTYTVRTRSSRSVSSASSRTRSTTSRSNRGSTNSRSTRKSNGTRGTQQSRTQPSPSSRSSSRRQLFTRQTSQAPKSKQSCWIEDMSGASSTTCSENNDGDGDDGDVETMMEDGCTPHTALTPKEREVMAKTIERIEDDLGIMFPSDSGCAPLTKHNLFLHTILQQEMYESQLMNDV